MDASERASSSRGVPSRQQPLGGSSPSDDCQFCGAKLDPAHLVVYLKTGAVTVRCDNCKEVNVPGEIKKEKATAPVIQLSNSIDKTEKLPISFQCPHCPKSFSLNFGLKRHILAAHPTTVDEKDLRKTENKSKGLISCCKNGKYRCPLCHKTFAHKLDLKTHALNAHIHMTLHNKNKRMKLCKLCGREFQHQKTLIAHIRVNHRVQKVKDSSTDSVEEIKGASHDNSLTGGKLFVCAYCSKNFPFNSRLVRHTRTHTAEKPFECKNCAKKYSQKSQLDYHTRLHHMEESEKDLECNHCGKKFAQNYDLKCHIKAIHTKPFECNHCDKKCGSKRQLDLHIKLHTGEKSYECMECAKLFSQRSHLDLHTRLHHVGEADKNFKCNHCGKKFAHNKDLKCHITRIHTKPFKCNHCDKKCGTKQELDLHIKAHHTGERPYGCKICGKCFVRRQNLERHEKALHGAEKVQQ